MKVFLKKKKKKKKQEYGCERYENLTEDENQKLVEYRKKYYKMRKNAFIYFLPGFRKFSRQTKSGVIPRYEKSFIAQLISSIPRV